ncbi:MAG: TonB family protein [Lacibacter sp.]|nr:TonB family protein [Lacibacter sp.]
MNSEQILKADLLDLIFDNRNKAYGAYSIRRAYPSHLKKAVGMMLLLVVALSVYVMSRPKKPSQRAFTIVLDPNHKLEDIKEIEKPKEQKPEQRTVEAQPLTKVDRPIVVVPDETQLKNPPIDRSDTTAYVPGSENKPAVGDGGEQFIQANAGDKTVITPNPPAAVVPLDPPVFEHPDEVAEFPGGIEAWSRYLQRMLRMPDELEAGDRKTVRVKFVVNATGEVTDAVVTLSAGKEFDKEVLRVISRMPKWKPGKQRGKPVASYFTQPVTFTATEE